LPVGAAYSAHIPNVDGPMDKRCCRYGAVRDAAGVVRPTFVVGADEVGGAGSGPGTRAREVVAALMRRGGQERGVAHTIAEGDAMNTALERLVTAVMARDDIPRSEAQHFVVLLLEELREVIEERPVPFRDFTPDDYRVNAQMDFQLAAH
jgi:hypothetical protein